MFSHVTVGTSDLERSGKFYDAVLLTIGLRRREFEPDDGPPMICWIGPDATTPRFYVCLPFDDKPASAGNGSMTAFLANSPEHVDAAYAAGMAAGGVCAGAPGLRPHYGPDYYAAYLRDPDGNKIHLVFRTED